jgi:hypothetical protein
MPETRCAGTMANGSLLGNDLGALYYLKNSLSISSPGHPHLEAF